jgi:hypothetical protein
MQDHSPFFGYAAKTSLFTGESHLPIDCAKKCSVPVEITVFGFQFLLKVIPLINYIGEINNISPKKSIGLTMYQCKTSLDSSFGSLTHWIASTIVPFSPQPNT